MASYIRENTDRDFIAETCRKIEFLSRWVFLFTNQVDQENNIYEKGWNCVMRMLIVCIKSQDIGFSAEL